MLGKAGEKVVSKMSKIQIPSRQKIKLKLRAKGVKSNFGSAIVLFQQVLVMYMIL